MSKRPDPAHVIQLLREMFPKNDGVLGLHEPAFMGHEWQYVKDCIDSGWVSSVGKYVDSFENQLAEYTGAKRAIAVVNGTAALHICLVLSGVEENDEVIVPALTFVATANAVSYCKAIPHFVDSEERTLGIDPVRLDNYLREITQLRGRDCYNKITGRRIKAVVPMHTYGHSVDLDLLLDVCNRFNLVLIEDAAESLGSLYKGRHTGNWGKISALSFNGNKIITTGGGGAILTNDEELGRLAKHITTTAKLPNRWEFVHDMVGYNYRMPNINAALGCAQIEQLPSYINKKRLLAKRYEKTFFEIGGAHIFMEPEHSYSNYWLNVLLLDENVSDLRDTILEQLNNAGIMSRPAWRLMHKLPMYMNCPRMQLDVSESLERRIINLPSSVSLEYGHA